MNIGKVIRRIKGAPRPIPIALPNKTPVPVPAPIRVPVPAEQPERRTPQ